MDRFNPYIDFADGSGYVAVKFYDISLKFNKSRKLNAFAQRDYLEGACKLKYDDARKAQVAFLDNNEYRLGLKVYEWGDDVSGTLIWEGWAYIKAKFDTNRDTVELNEFKTNDVYAKWEEYLETGINYNDLSVFFWPNLNDLVSEGKEDDCSKIITLDWDGTDFTQVGTPFSIPRTGKPQIALQTDSVVIYDNVTQTITRYATADSGLTWSASPNGTRTRIQSAEYASLAYRTDNETAFYDQGGDQFRTYQRQIPGTWNVIDTSNEDRFGKSALCFLWSATNQFYAFADNVAKKLWIGEYGGTMLLRYPFDLGDVDNVDIALIASDGTTHDIALVDGKTQRLRTYRFTPNAWTLLGTDINVFEVREPSIVDIGTNQVAIHDSYLGFIQAYQWDNVNLEWSTVGNSYTLDKGYYSSMVQYNDALVPIPGRIAMVIGDAVQLRTRFTANLDGLFNSLVYSIVENETGSPPNPQLDIDPTVAGDNFNIEDTYYIDLSAIDEAYVSPEIPSITLKPIDILNLIINVFQNYWYIENDPLSSSPVIDWVKFTQPDQFSSFGSDIDVSDQTVPVNIREYLNDILTEIEAFNFNNEKNPDFIGTEIKYGRNTPFRKDNDIPLTTDFKRVIDNSFGLDKSFEDSGACLVYAEQDTNIGDPSLWKYVCPATTGILTTENVRNLQLAKSYLMNTYLKDYRFANVGTIRYNNTDNAVQNTMRPIIQLPDIVKNLPDYPTGFLASLLLGGGDKAFITEAVTEWRTGLTTFKSVILDI